MIHLVSGFEFMTLASRVSSLYHRTRSQSHKYSKIVIYNSTIVIYNSTIVIYNSTIVIYNFTIVIYNSAAGLTRNLPSDFWPFKRMIKGPYLILLLLQTNFCLFSHFSLFSSFQ